MPPSTHASLWHKDCFAHSGVYCDDSFVIYECDRIEAIMVQSTAPGSTLYLRAALWYTEEIHKVPIDRALLSQAQQVVQVCHFFAQTEYLNSIYFHRIS